MRLVSVWEVYLNKPGAWIGNTISLLLTALLIGMHLSSACLRLSVSLGRLAQSLASALPGNSCKVPNPFILGRSTRQHLRRFFDTLRSVHSSRKRYLSLTTSIRFVFCCTYHLSHSLPSVDTSKNGRSSHRHRLLWQWRGFRLFGLALRLHRPHQVGCCSAGSQ
jgi:hypothetical protein